MRPSCLRADQRPPGRERRVPTCSRTAARRRGHPRRHGRGRARRPAGRRGPRAPHQPRRPGRAAGQGHADRLDDQAAARRGAQRPARREGPRPARRDPPALDRASSRTAWPPSWSRSSSGSPCRSRTTRPPTPSCASPRPSSSGGWKACSTASRPRWSPSRWRRRRSCSRCASCPRPPGPAGAPVAGHGDPPGVPGQANQRGDRRQASTSRTAGLVSRRCPGAVRDRAAARATRRSPRRRRRRPGEHRRAL